MCDRRIDRYNEIEEFDKRGCVREVRKVQYSRAWVRTITLPVVKSDNLGSTLKARNTPRTLFETANNAARLKKTLHAALDWHGLGDDPAEEWSILNLLGWVLPPREFLSCRSGLHRIYP